MAKKSQVKGKSRAKPRNKTKSKRKSGGSQTPKSYHVSRSARATDKMSITELQFLAKQRGITFAGLTKNKLIERINKYSGKN
jgi:hypothetical protein